MRDIGYYNGKTGPIDEMTVPMNDRALYFGDGIYDATFGLDGKVFLLEDHVERFYGNLERVGIVPYCTRQELGELLGRLLGQVDGELCFLYWQTSRGVAPRNHAFPREGKGSLYITVKPVEFPDMKKRIGLSSTEDTRFLHCDIKTLNLLPAVMAAQKAQEEGCQECVFHRGEVVTECSHSNISILKDGVLRTHPLDRYILPGIARKHLLMAAVRRNIPIDERPFTMDELRQADEVLVTSSSKLCLVAGQLEGRPVGGRAPELVEALQGDLLEELYRYVGRL